MAGDVEHPAWVDQNTSAAVKEEAARAGSRASGPVLVTGAAGFVGTHVCRELVRRGRPVRALVRSRAKAAARLSDLKVTIVEGDLRNPARIGDALHGASAVVHLAAIAIEKPGQHYEDINTNATRSLLRAARTAGVERFVYMSQNGASSDSPHRLLRSKGIAEQHVLESAFHWSVLRPSVVFGPEDEFVNVLARLVRLSPVLYPLPGGGRARFQPVAVDDLARAVAIVLESDAAVGHAYGIGGLTPLTLREMVERVLIAMHVHRTLIAVPVPVLYPVIAVAQRLLPNPPVTTSLLDLLELDNVVAGTALRDLLGTAPVPFAPEELTYLRTITAGDAVRAMMGR